MQHPDELHPNGLKILKLLSQDYTAPQISQELRLRPESVSHLRRLRQRFGMHMSLRQLVEANRRGLLE